MPIDKPLGSFRNERWLAYRLTTGDRFLLFPDAAWQRLEDVSLEAYWRFMARQLRRVGLTYHWRHAWRAFAD